MRLKGEGGRKGREGRRERGRGRGREGGREREREGGERKYLVHITVRYHPLTTFKLWSEFNSQVSYFSRKIANHPDSMPAVRGDTLYNE